jgi:hypothetical protein
MTRFALAIVRDGHPAGRGICGSPGEPTREAVLRPTRPSRIATGVIAPVVPRARTGRRISASACRRRRWKRYPWPEAGRAVMARAPLCVQRHVEHHARGGHQVNPELKDWTTAIIGQRVVRAPAQPARFTIRYSGDPAADRDRQSWSPITLLDYCQTPADHPGRDFSSACPTRGKSIKRPIRKGSSQIDFSACVGSGLVGAYKLTGNTRYWGAASTGLTCSPSTVLPGRASRPGRAMPIRGRAA